MAPKFTFQLLLQDFLFPDTGLGLLPSMSDAMVCVVVHSIIRLAFPTFFIQLPYFFPLFFFPYHIVPSRVSCTEDVY